MNFQSGKLNDALEYANESMGYIQEEEFKVELLKLRGQIHCDLHNFSEAIKDMGDVFEIVCAGKHYDDKDKESKEMVDFDKHRDCDEEIKRIFDRSMGNVNQVQCVPGAKTSAVWLLPHTRAG